MRICYLADGRYIHTHRWLKYFSQRGHEMFLLSFAAMDSHHLAAVAETNTEYLGELAPFYLKRFWRTAGELKRIRRTLKREKIDIVHSHFLGVNAWYGALSRFHPNIVTVMGGDVLGDNWQPGPDIRERWLTPFALRNADLITCWSSKLTNVIHRYSREHVPVEVVHGGVDLTRFFPGPGPEHLRAELNIPSDARVILSPRLMRPLYNLDKIAAAAQIVWKAVPNSYFVFTVVPVATDFAYQQKVQEIVKHDTAGRVRFLEAVPHDRMADYYRLADVTISIPSSDGTPMSVLESFACGTPAIVSDIPNYDPDYIERDKTVLMVDPDNVHSVASAIVKLLGDPVAIKLASEGRQRVLMRGSYDAQMARMEELYRSLMLNKRTNFSSG